MNNIKLLLFDILVGVLAGLLITVGNYALFNYESPINFIMACVLLGVAILIAIVYKNKFRETIKK